MLIVSAEMDSPIPIIRLHPYGRRRGRNGLIGAGTLNVYAMYSGPFIMWLKVQINSNEPRTWCYFLKKYNFLGALVIIS
jgi:hypothetical protein